VPQYVLFLSIAFQQLLNFFVTCSSYNIILIALFRCKKIAGRHNDKVVALATMRLWFQVLKTISYRNTGKDYV
jgi:hypothetical protein